MSATNGTFAHHVRDAANRFIARRFVPVPVRFGTKKPNLMDGWERLRIETASPAEIRFDLDVHFPATEIPPSSATPWAGRWRTCS